jgi:hypothetical protein
MSRPAQRREREREVRIEIERLLEQPLGPQALLAARFHDLARLQVEAVGLRASRGRAIQHRALVGPERDVERLHDALRNFRLHVEQVLERTVEAVGPQRVAVRGAQELGADARAVPGAPHAAQQQEIGGQLARQRAGRERAVAERSHLGA